MQTDSTQASTESPQPPQKHVTTACSRCRTRKAKCDGKFPCNTCSAKRAKCEYEQRQDGRTTAKRTHDELNTRSEMLHTIIHSLRTNNARFNEELLEIIRSGATTAEIAQYASDLARRNENSVKRTRQNVMNISTLVDEPLVRVPAQSWTTITQDDDVVSHLISVYLTWHHSTYPAFDPEILVREARSNDLTSRYCSKFLINAVLALACLYTDHPAAFENSNDVSTRSLHYLREAIRLWELEDGQATLTNLQGLTIMIVAVVLLGRDRMALLYGSQLNILRQDLFYKIRQARKNNSNEYSSKEFQRSWGFAAWASFQIEVEMSMAWRTSFNLFKPTVARPYPKDDLEAREIWRAYPATDPEVVYNPRMIDDAGFSLYEIGADICSILLSGNPQDSPLPNHIILEPAERLKQAQAIEHNLLAWQDGLPTISISREHTTVPYLAGPMVELQLTYNVWRIEVNGIVFREDAVSQKDRVNAGEKIIAACKRVAALLRYAQTTFGMLSFPSHTMHAASLCAHNLIEFLSQPDVPDLFHTMILTLTAVCQRWTLARGITRTIWITVRERKVEDCLLESTVSLLKLNAVENWGPEDHRLFSSCTYPNYASSKNGARDITGVGDLLASYAQLNIDDEERRET